MGQEHIAGLPERLKELDGLAYNLWWSWHPAARMLFKMLNRQGWKGGGHNPVKMLRDIPEGFCSAVLANAEYMALYDRVIGQFKKDTHAERNCFEEPISAANANQIAFFSAEYGLHHSLPFYAGGLGFLAGDYLKEASDLRVPLVAIGFMYPEGYVRQRIREDGWQESLDEDLDRGAASISKVLNDKGEQQVIQVPFIEPPIHVALWKIDVGNTPLYLMDTDIPLNDPWNRQTSQHLYTGDLEQRLRQEIVLGIGGSEVLENLGTKHLVVHLNEGHAAFAVLERIRQRVQSGRDYREAAEEVRQTTVFTTHTPVPAGHDVFPFSLIEKYFRSYWPGLGLDRDGFMQLGVDPKEPDAGFNMTVLALRMSAHHNAVSKKHGQVARRMWQALWPELPEQKVPIDHVTNGIHVPTWIEPKMELLFNRYLGPNWLLDHDQPALWERIDTIPDKELWQTHHWLKIKLIDAIRERSRQRWVKDKMSPSVVIAGGVLLDPSVFTIGFARRFVTYKRADLIFHDLERLKKLLNDRWQPIQIIFSGKAHPSDDAGKRILQEVFTFARDPALAGRIAVVEDYGEQLAQYLVHGVDIWLNNPLPPSEACGTSGMKAALNGVPHLSVPDGWWIEGFNGKNGWAFGAEEDTTGDRDRADAQALYGLLEKEIIPLYYRVDEEGTPQGWVKVMKESIKSNAPRFSSRRMLKEYIDKIYKSILKTP